MIFIFRFNIIVIITGTTALCEPWPSSGFLNNWIFTVWGCQPHVQPQTWRTRVSLFVWLLPLDLSSLGGLTSSYATAGIALRVSGALKPHHHHKVERASVDIIISHKIFSPTAKRKFLFHVIVPRTICDDFRETWFIQWQTKENKTRSLFVRKRTIPTDRPLDCEF
jgi:hypothetical protein